jgi:membrane fusion protein (multidrug efflux system)
MTYLHPAFALVLPLFTAFVVSACSDSTPSAAPTSDSEISVEAVTASVRDVEVILDAVGIAEASEEAEIRPQVDATVAEILYQEGLAVRAGDMLVRLDDAKPAAKLELQRASLDSAKASLRLADQRLRRGRQLISGDLISKEAFEELESEQLAAAAAVREGDAEVTLAARELDDYHIRAPFDGTVGRRLVDVGNYVQRGDALVVLMKTDPVEIEFQIPDQYGSQLETGMAVRVTPAASETVIEATLSFINPRVDPSTRMLDLKATAGNTESALRDGQFVSVKLLLAIRQAQVLIPEEAVVSMAGDLAVYVVEDGIARHRPITIGVRQPREVEILSGVKAGETVVIGGQHRLHDGAKVAVLGAPAPDGA